MTQEQADKLYELAELIHAVARQLGVPADLKPEPCTPVEVSVMRFVGRNPGTSARAAARATLLPSSNFSRVLRGLMRKGLLLRKTDEKDARCVRLYPTATAKASMEHMRHAWSQALDGAITDPTTVELVNATLRRVESQLLSQSQTPARKADQQRPQARPNPSDKEQEDALEPLFLQP